MVLIKKYRESDYIKMPSQILNFEKIKKTKTTTKFYKRHHKYENVWLIIIKRYKSIVFHRQISLIIAEYFAFGYKYLHIKHNLKVRHASV